MNSRERVKELQKMLDVTADGIIGRQTLNAFAAKYGKTKAQVAHFFGQIHHESGGFSIVRENMNYRAPRIMEIFGVGRHSAKVTQSESKQLAGNSYALAERVYGLGNPRKAKELGNIKVGDGYKYRGGGALQCTGRADYNRYGGLELECNPDLIGDSAYYFTTAIKEFDVRNTWALAKVMNDDSIKAVTKRVNGGYNGLSDRIAKTKYYYGLF